MTDQLFGNIKVQVILELDDGAKWQLSGVEATPRYVCGLHDSMFLNDDDGCEALLAAQVHLKAGEKCEGVYAFVIVVRDIIRMETP